MSSRLFSDYIELAEVGSTNVHALDLGRRGLVVTARRQTGGRGRRGRHWVSPQDVNLYLSVTLGKPQTVYPILAGVAVREALSGLLQSDDPMIKWPNDILCGRRKICGILCESRGRVTAVGIGLNVNQRQWPQEIAGIATSMAELAGRDFEIAVVRDAIVFSLEKWIATWQLDGFGPVRDEFLAHSYTAGQPGLLEDGTACMIVDMDAEGHLVVEIDGRRQTIASGEVVLKDFRSAGPA